VLAFARPRLPVGAGGGLCRCRPGLGGERGDIDGVEGGHAPLGDDVEGPQRFDLVAVEFEADGAIPVEREQIDDPAAAGKRPRGLEGVDGPPAPGAEPVGELLRIELPPHLEPAGAGLDLARIGERGKEGLDRGDDDRRAVAAGHGEPLDEQEPAGGGGVLGDVILPDGEALERRQVGDGEIGEQGEIVDEPFGIDRMREDDDKDPLVAELACQSRGRERRTRAPGSADRSAVSLFETADDVGEPAVRAQECGQPCEPRRRPGIGRPGRR
jgi:hypothetical protein